MQALHQCSFYIEEFFPEDFKIKFDCRGKKWKPLFQIKECYFYGGLSNLFLIQLNLGREQIIYRWFYEII